MTEQTNALRVLHTVVPAVVALLDAHDRAVGIPPEIALELRVGKVHEEVGEAWEALIACWGQNPRKPRGTEEELRGELYDVALTALVAIVSLNPIGSWSSYLEQVTSEVGQTAAGIQLSGGWHDVGPRELLTYQLGNVAERAGETSRRSCPAVHQRRDRLHDVLLAALGAAAFMTDVWADEFGVHATTTTSRLQPAGKADGR